MENTNAGAYEYVTLQPSLLINRLYTVHYFEYMNDFSFPGEAHNFWEFLCVDKGEVNVVAGSRTLSLKKDEYVLAARALGAGPMRILRRHILPGCAPVVLAAAAMQVPSAIFTESFLSFIGLGVQAPMPSLGSLANAARGAMGSFPHKLVFPAVALCLIVLAFDLISDGLRAALDPRAER